MLIFLVNKILYHFQGVATVTTAGRFIPVTADYIVYKIAKSFWWESFIKRVIRYGIQA